ERLTAITVPAGRIDMIDVLPAARRRVARRRIAVVAGSAALTAVALIAVPALLPDKKAATGLLPAEPTSCVRTELTAPAGVSEPIVRGVDPSGRYIIGTATAGGLLRPVLWTDGTATVLPAMKEVVEATDVNQTGVVVGLVGGAEGGGTGAARYENGRWTSLELPPGQWNVSPEPRINAGGDVIVDVEPSAGGPAVHLLWRAGTTAAERVTLPGGAAMRDIADDGGIAGVIGDAAWVWDRTGKGTELEKSDGQAVTAYAIRGDWVAGGVSGDQTGAVWNRRTGRITRLNAEGPAAAVNSSGWAVTDNATLRDGAALDLGGGTAIGVSDTGLVVGHDADERNSMWRC
ncbi:hypothetical protein AB0M20_34240, partial [Actinoplanes sp. NPDC051633]|uniref:hypothetical protein n=1 Tax=Actinoplanes sp. NPDC051633 TaxID=3155670 RepID=UPI00342F7D8F